MADTKKAKETSSDTEEKKKTTSEAAGEKPEGKSEEKASEDKKEVKSETEGAEAKKETSPQEKPAEEEAPKAENQKGEAAAETKSEEKEEGKEEGQQGEGEEKKEEQAEEKPASETKKKEEKKEEKKKPKRFKLPFFSKDKQEEKKDTGDDGEGKEDEEVTPSEAVDELDPENKLSMSQTIKNLAQEIDEQIEEATDEDYWVIRINKKKLVIILGLLVIAMWIVPMAKGLESVLGVKLLFWEKSQQTEEVKEENQESGGEAEIQEASIGAKIRIRVIGDNQVQAASIAGKLKENGFDYIEMVEDDENNYEKLLISTKPDQEELKQKLRELLMEDYRINETGENVEITEDSDLDAVLFVGNGAEKGNEESN